MNEARLDAGPTPPTLSMVSRSIVSYEVKHTLGPMFDLATDAATRLMTMFIPMPP